MKKIWDIAVIGGGAAGLTAAIEAKRTAKTLSVLLLEKNASLGRKLAATGNGRCNLSNRACAEQETVLRFFAPVLLTSASVSCVGSLGFVGLMAPHMARFVLRGGQVSLLCGSALIGALLVLATDTLGRLAFAPLQIPAGIVIALVGCPFFVVLLWRRRDAL